MIPNKNSEELRYFCLTWNTNSQTYMFTSPTLSTHTQHDYYILHKPDKSLTEMADKINNYKLSYESKISSLTVDKKVVFEKLWEEARGIKKLFEQRIMELVRSIDVCVYDVVLHL